MQPSSSLDEVNYRSSPSESPSVTLSLKNDETRANNVFVSTSNLRCGDELLETRCNLEFRKDLLMDLPHVSYINEHGVEEGIFKSEPLAIEFEVDSMHHHHQQQSFLTLTTLPSIPHSVNESIVASNSDNSLVSNNVSNLFTLNTSPSCWVTSQHEDGNYLNANYNFLGSSSGHFQRAEVYSQSEFAHHTVVETQFKPSVQIGHNPLYHLDTNNRRIW